MELIKDRITDARHCAAILTDNSTSGASPLLTVILRPGTLTMSLTELMSGGRIGDVMCAIKVQL